MSVRTLIASFFAAFLAAMLFVSSASATTLLRDSFNHSTGLLNGAGPGEVGFSGPWTGATNYTVQNGSLVYPAGATLNSKGNSARTTGAAGNVQIFQPMTTGIDFDTPGTYYVSFLVNKHDASQNSGEFFWLGLSNSGDDSYKSLWGLGSTEAMLLGSAGPFSGFDITATSFYSANETYLYTAKIVTTNAGNDMYYAKLYSLSSDIVPETEPVSWDVTHVNSITGVADRLEWFTGANSNYTLDEFRLGTTWFDVTQVQPIPEPTSISLLAMGLLGLISRRRRARRV